MAHQFSAIMFTDGVKAVQTEFGSREKQAVFAERAPANDVLTERDCPPEQLAAVALDDYKSRIERIVHFDLVAFDWNCPQHIKRRYTAEEFAALAWAANVSGPIAAPIPPEH